LPHPPPDDEDFLITIFTDIGKLKLRLYLCALFFSLFFGDGQKKITSGSMTGDFFVIATPIKAFTDCGSKIRPWFRCGNGILPNVYLIFLF